MLGTQKSLDTASTISHPFSAFFTGNVLSNPSLTLLSLCCFTLDSPSLSLYITFLPKLHICPASGYHAHSGRAASQTSFYPLRKSHSLTPPSALPSFSRHQLLHKTLIIATFIAIVYFHDYHPLDYKNLEGRDLTHFYIFTI